MALKFPDRCRETTTSTGTGPVTLGGAEAMHRAFSTGLSNADTTYFIIAARDGSGWELALGTYTSASNSLSRDSVVASSNSGASVSFGAGVKDVMSAWPGALYPIFSARDVPFWVAAGTYDPIPCTDGQLSFTLANGSTSNIQLSP